MFASSGNTHFDSRAARSTRRSATARALAIALFGLATAQTPLLGQAEPARTGQAPRIATGPGEAVTLSPGDVVRITVWRKPELSGEFAIAGDGTIVHPLYKDVRVAGIPMDAVETLIRGVIEKIERTPFVVEPLLRVSVEGEVRQPSVYSLRPETSIAQAIAMAGGPTERGRAEKVRVVRAGGEITVDLRRADVGASRQTVRSGDRIVVDRSRAVFRDVLSPMITVLGATAAIVSVILYSGNR